MKEVEMTRKEITMKEVEMTRNRILCSKNFLIISCAFIFFLSIFLRSIIDIGPDTGVYIDLGKKIAQGKKYYYHFFESNFPLSFYIYAVEYSISNLLHINPIITSELIINILAILAIFWSAKILQKTTIYDDKAHYNLIIISYVLSFFLRIGALQIGEFGTKTSLLLICLYPYISFSFERKILLTKKELLWRGILMGLIGCLKPHYLIFIIFIEFYKFWQKKSLKFFFEIDKLITVLIGCAYLLFMIKFTPEFFEFMVPMWQKVYGSYDNYKIFLNNSFQWLATKTAIYAFIFLIFSRLKFSYNDKILALLFAAASALMVLENIGTIDQGAVFYAIATICMLKFTYDLIGSQKFSFSENKFIITSLVFLPIFDLDNFPWLIFSASGFINIWWFAALIIPVVFFIRIKKEQPSQWQIFKTKNFGKKVIIAACVYILLLITTLLSIKYLGLRGFVTVNLLSLFIVLFFFEKLHAKFYKKFSPFFVFVVTVTIYALFYSYVKAVADFSDNKIRIPQFPNTLSDNIANYAKIYAPKKEDGILVFSDLNSHQFPIINYLGKENYLKSHTAFIGAEYGGKGKFFYDVNDQNKVFTFTYLFESLKSQIKNQNIKLIFINADKFNAEDRCYIGFLEYYLLDPEFKKIFFKNFHYESRIVMVGDIKMLQKNLPTKNPNIFDQIKPSDKKVVYDFEVYVRN